MLVVIIWKKWDMVKIIVDIFFLFFRNGIKMNVYINCMILLILVIYIYVWVGMDVLLI